MVGALLASVRRAERWRQVLSLPSIPPHCRSRAESNAANVSAKSTRVFAAKLLLIYGPMTKPTIIYYRWCHSPSTGDVTLSHNYEGHPTDINYHSDMAHERKEQDLEFGYAYRMDNGWKVTDADHKPSQDPFTREAVERAIHKYEGRKGKYEAPSED